MVVLLVSARIARSPREPATSGVQVIDNRSSGAAPAASDLELGAQPPRSITEAVDVPRPPADSVAMPTLAAPAEPDVVKTTSARPDAATNGLAARKTTAPPRPALRSPPAKASVPDDGRDELYPAGGDAMSDPDRNSDTEPTGCPPASDEGPDADADEATVPNDAPREDVAAGVSEHDTDDFLRWLPTLALGHRRRTELVERSSSDGADFAAYACEGRPAATSGQPRIESAVKVQRGRRARRTWSGMPPRS